jgi:hypothetical protein
MVHWSEFVAAEPAFARRVQERFERQKHMTLATLRRDGSPRISGTEVVFADGEIRLGMMAGSLKGLDLLRDPRMALHSPSVDPPADDPSAWVGEAKIAGRAVEVPGEDDTTPGEAFRIDVGEVVMTTVGTPPDHLLIESWDPAHGLRRRTRE